MEYVAYYRVSTKKQGRSGLGLEAQKIAIYDYINRKIDKIIGEYTEIESGRNNTRPILKAALNFARKNKAVLIVAKLDRLARNVGFTMAIRDSNVSFLALDVPYANTLTLGIQAVFAQDESEKISERVKMMWKAKKARPDYKPNKVSPECREASLRVRRMTTNIKLHTQITIAYELRQKNYSLQRIADELNKKGLRTSRDCLFTHSSVSSLLKKPIIPLIQTIE